LDFARTPLQEELAKLLCMNYAGLVWDYAAARKSQSAENQFPLFAPLL
jgi:hypothetical protein